MKIKNLFSAAVLSLAAAFAPTWAEAHSGDGKGDIYSIDLSNSAKYGGVIPSASKPATIGDKIVIRVRLGNPDFAVSGGGASWKFLPTIPAGETISSLFPPKLGIKLGDAAGEAELVDTVPVASPAGLMTDLFFRYTVKAGDLAWPALLMGSDGGPATTGATYFLYNSTYWTLASTETQKDASLRDVTGTLSYRYPWNIKGAGDQNYTPTGTGLGIYVKTIDFDGDYKVAPVTKGDEGLWREFYRGMTTTSSYQPSIVPDGPVEVGAKMYVWVEDEAIAQPVGDDAETVDVLDAEGNKIGERYVLPVTLGVGETVKAFEIMGLANGETHVILSSTPNNVYDGSGTLIENTTRRRITVIEPPSPYITFTLLKDGGKELPSDTVICQTNYWDYVAKLIVRLNVDDSRTQPVTVHLNPTLDDADVFEDYILGIASSTLGEPYIGKVDEWTFAPGVHEKEFYIYAKGATTKSATDGVTFTPSVTGPGAGDFPGDDDQGCTLLVEEMQPILLDPYNNKEFGRIIAGEAYTFDMLIGASYKKLMEENFYDEWRIMYNIGSGWVGRNAPYESPDDGSYDASTGYFTYSGITFPSAKPEGYTVQLQVKSGTKSSNIVTFHVDVQDANSVWAEFDRSKYAEGKAGDAEVKFFVSAPQPQGKDMWCFLEPINDDAKTKTDSNCFTTKGLKAIGCYIPAGRTNSTGVAVVHMLDGDANPIYKVHTKLTENFKAGSEVYNNQQVDVRITNIVAQVNKVAVGGRTIGVAGGTLDKKLAVGVSKKFSVSVKNECDADLQATGADVFKTRWTFNGGSPVVMEGDPGDSDAIFTSWTPNAEGLLPITVEFQDKDMRAANEWSEPFEFFVDVIAAPAMTIEPVYGESYNEDVPGPLTAPFKLKLNVPPDFDDNAKKLRVKLWVTTRAGAPVDEKLFKLSDEYLDFNTGVSSASFYIDDMDGVMESEKGYQIHAEVDTEASDADLEGKTWKGFVQPVYVLNNPPEITSPKEQVDAEGNAVAQTTEVGTTITLDFAVKDIDADLTNGLSVVWKTSEGEGMTTNSPTGSFTFRFKTSGSKYALMTVKDKDGGTTSLTINYKINAAKKLTTVSSGPLGGYGTTLSARYASAPGVGAGHTFAGKVAFSSAEQFQIDWNCAVLKSVTAYAWGYKVGAVDDGFLNSEMGTRFAFDIPLDLDGCNMTDGATDLPDYYAYADPVKDSFLYCWLAHDTAEGSTESSVAAVTPEKLGSVPALPVALPEADSSGDSKDSVSYPDTVREAVFAKEYLPGDNMGDINQDGIPDLFVKWYCFEVFDETGELVGDDLKLIVNEENGDNLDEDYLPASEGASYSTLIPGLKETWVKTGGRFTAKMEIRGYHDGLNSASEIVGVKADRIYAARGEDGKLCYPENATISRVEYEAWLDFAEAHGLDPTNTVSFQRWTPEYPTNPMEEDTNGNGMPDGYEYYFWYQAHVGQGEGVNHRYLTGRRYDPKNPGVGKLITSKEIEDRVTSGTSGDWTDTDNDGLPDLIEMEIGTNPFDFDTDGDGLPDGWEIIVAGTSPYTAFTTPGISDAMRNFDGDAMAFNTPELERMLTTPQNYHVEDPYVFALEDANGDSDGVQWYTTKFEPAVTNSENVVSGALIRVDGGSVTNFYMTTAKGYRVTEDNVLMTELLKSETWQVALIEDLTNDLPSVAGAPYQYVRLAPTTIPAGTRFLEAPTKNPDEFEAFGFLTLAESAPELDCNAAWFYGSSAVSTMTTGQDTANVGGFGMLALGRYQGAPAGVPLTALPRKYSNLAYLHYLVYQEWGFDPRTAWNANTPLAPRWAKKKTTGTGDSQTSETYDNISQGSYAGIATRTREFTTYDEFLLYSFWINNGCETPSFATRYDDVLGLVNEWLAQTTNPQGPNEPDIDTDGEEAGEEGSTIPYHGRNSDNGADTDLDGVPDGWELYVMTGPKYNLMGMKLCYVFGGPNGSAPNANRALFPMVAGDSAFGHMSPLVAEAGSTKTDNKTVSGDQDDLTELQEYAGTDSCAYYSEAAEGATPFSTTIVRPAEHANWLNKFFPTDPWASDTDHDGVTDVGEFEGGRAMNRSHSFVYGEPADNGSTCIVGGGLNPCSVDTDLDGLPDGWESQYPGQEIYSEGYAVAHNLFDADGNPIIDYAKDADGKPVGNPLQGLVDGMDGTVPDAFNTPFKNYATTDGDSTYSASKIISINGARQVVDRDYDHDGLSNWQEYLTGAMRCWRYDDPFSPWTYVPTEDWFIVNGETNEFSLAKAMAAVGTDDPGEFWYKTLVDKSSPYYAPRLQTGTGAMSQYFTWLDPRKYGFDPAYSDTGSYYIFFSRIGDDNLAEWWGGEKGLNIEGDFPKEPSRYISTSPVEADSDHDGMDDYYELFHGMNPLLGEAGVTYESDGPCDLVFDAWKDTATNKAFHDAEDNYWTRDPEKLLGKTPRCKLEGNMYDFELFPWLNGAANADPDGDDIRNQQEAVMPMVAPATIWYHTDPTPLWMTDSSYTNSLVTRFFRVAITPKPLSLGGESFTYNGETYYFCELTGGYYIDPMEGPKLKPYTPDQWSLTGSADKKNWMFSFEENEGYDSDHDGIGDYEELQGKFTSATDPKDADSPHRRQAMYFPGQDAALQSMPYEEEKHPLGHTGYPDDMSFVQYTVECWVYPERDTDQTILERAVWSTFANPGDQEYLRRNFQIAIRQGRWYTMFDPNGTLSNRQVSVISSEPIALNAWTHIAATYDTEKLTLYVNGVPEPSQPANLTPEYGSSAVTVYPGDPQSMQAELNNAKGNMYWFDREYQYVALLMGASFKGVGDAVTSPSHLNVMNGKGWNCYKSFFRGYIDEVRIWDGARSEEQVRDNMKVRFTAETAKKNRDDFYDLWAVGNRRYAKNEAGNDYRPIPELRYHFSFDSIPGAASPEMVAKTPFGFGDEGPKARLSRPEGYEIPWWSKVLAGYTGTVYGYPAWIQWIPNTVTHLPRFDTTTLDSMYWSEDFAGDQVGSYKFARSAEPVSMWTQMTRNKIAKDDDFYSTDRRYWQVYTSGTNRESNLTKLFEFTGRHLNQMGDDLLPLGGAYVKYTDVMWDAHGPSSNWEISGGDADNDGLPDWWSEWAKDNYRRDDMDPGDEITWDTIVKYHGRLMTAGEAYRLDLAKGFYANEYGEIVTDSDESVKRRQTADEDGDGMTDWWEDLHGLQTWSKDDAEADPDNDGLNNYSEYLVAQGEAPYGFTNLNPKAARSFVGQQVSDYFLPVPEEFADEKHISKNEYLGAVFTDHDFMEEWWENKYPLSYANSRIYDPWDDPDGDGWSNFSECRAMLWGGIFSADLVDRYLDGNDRNQVDCYPQPAIGIKFNYEKDQINDTVGRRLMVRTSTGGKLMDATFLVIGADERDPEKEPGIVPETHFVGGYFEESVVRGFLNPGNVVPVGVSVRRASLSSEDNLWWNYNWYVEHWGDKELCYHATPPYGYGTFEEYRNQLRRYPHIELEEGNVTWEAFGVVFSDGEGHYGTIKDGTTEIGTIDFHTGEYSLDMSKIRVKGEAPSSYVFAIDYQYRIGANWPQTLWLSETKTDKLMDPKFHEVIPLLGGRVKEGLNTIEAFIDLNNNTLYDIGEPYGCAKNVPVGWHKVPEITIELTDKSEQFQRTALLVEQGEGAATGVNQSHEVTVRIMRDAINGKAAESPLLVKTLVPEDRGYITEADIISDRMPELDWGWLPRNAVEVQYSIVQSVPFADGSVSNAILSTFTKMFNPSNRPAVSVVSPIANEPVYSSAPTFRFAMEGTASAFAVQVGCEVSSGKTNVIYDSGVQLRGGRESVAPGQSAYSFTAPIYANASIGTNGAPVLLDGSNYFWRVASFNAKFSSARDADYSAWTPFQMDVANVNRYPHQATGYGSVAAAVRYFGPARTNDLTNLIVVEAFENADFTGQALAQTRVGSTNDLDNANLRTDTLAVTNACLMGVTPGIVYLRAYIDLNNNGRWDRFEPWGYANNVGRYGETFLRAPIYNPLGIEVSRGIGDVVKPNVAAIFIEDTDCDKNEIPDCLQEWPADTAEPDADGDGLSDYEEENVYGTNPYDAYSIWLRNGGDESAKYTDGEAIRFNLLDGNVGTDSDFDGLTNWQELQAYKRDKKLDLKVDDPMSDGLTNDYFRVYPDGYTGELNGAEWIEFAARDFFGMNNLSHAGTRDLLNEGWDMWSISRYILNGGTIVQWNAIGEGGATTNANELSYEPIPSLKVTLLYRGGGSKDVRFAAYQGALKDLGNDFPATEWKSAVGFDNGVGKLTLSISNRVEETGTLKQGPARIVAYIDNDGDGKLSEKDTVGTAETEIGWANHELTIRLGDPCDALPVIDLEDGSNGVFQTVAIVRVGVNGKYLDAPRGVTLRRYENNVNRTRIYPSDFVDEDFIGLDRYLALDPEDEVDPSEEDGTLEKVESVTYEIVKVRRADVGLNDEDVEVISNTNLNHYVWVEDVLDPETEEVVSNILHTVDQELNERFTVRYSITRDVPLFVKGDAASTEGDVLVTFTVPTDRAVTKFWLKVDGADQLGPDGRGYVLYGLSQNGQVVLDSAWFAKNKISLPAGSHRIQVALGNDKFPEIPVNGDEWSKEATFSVGAAAAFEGEIGVSVVNSHLADIGDWDDAKVVIAAYETPDLVNPVAMTNGMNATLKGLRVGAGYYVAAWYVKDGDDGRGSVKYRQPYDTWGYATMQGESQLCFNAKPIVAAKTGAATVVYLQDTDWNDNNVVDRRETIKSKPGITPSEAPEWDPLDVDGDGIPNEDDDDPVFDNSKKALEGDWMAYQLKKTLCVQIGTMNDETNWVWYAVSDPMSEPTADKLSGPDIIIPRGTKASELKTLYTTYQYGRKKSSPYGIGKPVTLAEGEVKHYEWKQVALVHHQVYQENGFDPRTANALLVVTNCVNTKKFTAIDKYLVTNYLAAVGALAPDAVMTNWTLTAKRIDFDFDGIPDGWELYTMFGTNAVQTLTKTAKDDVLNAWVYDDRNLDADGDLCTNLHEYDGGAEPTDPWNKFSLYENLAKKGLLLPGTPKFDDAAARKFGLSVATANEDGDLDLISNIQEMTAYYRDPTALADLSVTNAWSDGETPDYFRACGSKYLGELFNGAEFIEPDLRKDLGITMLSRTGTRDAYKTGWSLWSMARSQNAPKVTLDELTESEKLDLVLKYMTLEHPDRFNGQSLDDVIDYIVQRNRDRDVTYLWALDSIDDVIIWVGHAGGGDPEECKDIGYSIINKTIREKSGQEVGDSSYVLPEPSISLMLKYAGNEQCSIMFEAYQVTSIYPEYGEQVSAKWTLQSQQFVAGVAKIDLGAPSAGMLVEGPARFVAYIDVDGDGTFSAGDTFGETTANVGYLGCDLTIRMADANASAFPVISLVDETASGEGAESNSVGRVINTVAIVRTKVNGEYLEKPRGVMLRRYENNVNRTRLYPSDFVDVDYIGIDRYLSEETDDEVDPSEDELPAVEEVTYEIVKLRRSAVNENEDEGNSISNTNLNHYVWSEDVLDPETEEVVSNILHTVDQQLNEEFTVRYSVARDVPMEVKGEALSTANGAVLSFTVPTDRTVTKFWLEIADKGGPATPFYGDANRGFALDGLVQAGAGENLGRVILDADWFTANNVTAALTEGTKTVRVALGNDKFPGAPNAADTDEWSAAAEFTVAQAAVRTGVIDVKVKHPTEPAATFAGKLTVAVYEKADLANPVAVTNGCSADTTVEIAGLRPDGSYYVAAWYVKDAKDGRGSADDRMPYDTWGYLTMLGRGANGFDAKAVKAVDPENRMVDVPMVTNLVFMQDTDWNDNGVADRLETIKSVLGENPSAAPEWDEFDVDGDGIPNDDDDDPVFDNSGDWLEGDVMAYQTKRVLCVQIGTMDAETNWVWYVVNDPANETSADKLSGDVIIIPRGTPASELSTLYTTYVYGRKKSSPLGIGQPVTLAEGEVYHYEWKDIVLVHNQVYRENGFNPNTANALISEADWVNSKKFTKVDKFIVTNYLSAVGALASDAAMTNWVLRASDKKHKYNIDFDFDGIPDGWELYTMFGDHEPTVLTKTSVANVLNAWVADDRDNDPDGDELANLHEYDGGHFPTDPWNGESAIRGLSDAVAQKYDLKGPDGLRRDSDNDQLSNFMEMLISETSGLPTVDPGRMATSGERFGGDQLVPDYFLRVGSLYLGEMFADHDFIEDWYEDGQPVEIERGETRIPNVSRFTYDAHRDADGNGWTAWSEARARIAGGKVSVVDSVVTNVTDAKKTVVVTNFVEKWAYDLAGGRPDPTLKLALSYYGDRSGLAPETPIVVRAWQAKRSIHSDADAKWVASNATDSVTLDRGNLTEGHLGEGSYKFAVFADENGDGEYQPSEPFGFASDISVGYCVGTTVGVELTDVSPSIVRIDLAKALALQAERIPDLLAGAESGFILSENQSAVRALYAEMYAATDRGGPYGKPWATSITPVFVGTNMNFATSNAVSIRVVRALINSKGGGATFSEDVVFEGTLPLTGNSVLTEADLADVGILDLDWDDGAYKSPSFDFASVTSMTYRIVFIDQAIDAMTFNNNLAVTVVNHFELGGHQTPAQLVEVRAAGARPTFVWKHENTLGKTYPAFRLRVWKKDGKTLVFDSGDLRAPARGSDGVYSWTAPLSDGMLTPEGQVFDLDEEYVWSVSMLDAKFAEDWDFQDGVAEKQTFRLSTCSDFGGVSDYGQIAAAVKYMGPGTISTNAVEGLVRVEAYATPDFAGTPVSVGYVKHADTVADANLIEFNALVRGLPPGRDYYLMAYLDTNGNGKRDVWESWGYGNYVGTDRKDVYTPRVYSLPARTEATFDMPKAVIYLEDCDTNDNKVPDVMEWDKKTDTLSLVKAPVAQSPYIVRFNGTKWTAKNAYLSLDAGVLKLPFYWELTKMQDGETLSSVALALAMSGIDPAKLDVEPEVRIVEFSLTDGVKIEVSPRATVDGETLKPSVVSFSVTLKLTLQHVNELTGTWEDVAEVSDTFDISEDQVQLDPDKLAALNAKIGEYVDGKSGFFQVKVELVK